MGHNGDYPLDNSAIKDWQNAMQTAGALEQGIIDRIDYVLKVWFKAFGSELKNWYFDGAEEGSMGNMRIGNDNIYGICLDSCKGNQNFYDMIILDKDDDEYGWEYEVPIRWLFDNDFEKEIIEGKRKYEEKKAAQKEDLKIKRAKQRRKI